MGSRVPRFRIERIADTSFAIWLQFALVLSRDLLEDLSIFGKDTKFSPFFFVHYVDFITQSFGCA